MSITPVGYRHQAYIITCIKTGKRYVGITRRLAGVR